MQKRKTADQGDVNTEKPKKRSKKAKEDDTNRERDVTVNNEHTPDSEQRAVKAPTEDPLLPEHTTEGSASDDEEVEAGIKQEQYDAPVDINLYTSAAQLLEEYEYDEA